MIACEDPEFVGFVTALAALESGYHSGYFGGRRYGVTIERPAGARITKLLARELGDSDIVSFNLFLVGNNQAVLKPCEMPSEKVIDFVLRFAPSRPHVDNVNCNVVAMQ